MTAQQGECEIFYQYGDRVFTWIPAIQSWVDDCNHFAYDGDFIFTWLYYEIGDFVPVLPDCEKPPRRRRGKARAKPWREVQGVLG